MYFGGIMWGLVAFAMVVDIWVTILSVFEDDVTPGQVIRAPFNLLGLVISAAALLSLTN